MKFELPALPPEKILTMPPLEMTTPLEVAGALTFAAAPEIMRVPPLKTL
jgi:hypothetical protein